jgi:hypothetical protein
MDRIFLDIETIPGAHKPDPSEVKAPANYKDPEKIRAYQDANVDESYRAQALDSLAGRIICVGLAINDADPEGITGPEADILGELSHRMQDADILEIIGFNLRSFDLLWLRHRAYKYGFPSLASLIPWQRYDKRVLDLREVWTGGDMRGKGTLGEICRFLGVGEKSGIGGGVFDLWQAGKEDEIVAYCCHDVELTRAVWRKMFPREAALVGKYS